VARATVGPLLWRIENPCAHAGRQRRESGFYDRVELPPDSRPLVGCESERPEAHLRLRWFPLAELGVVDLRPSILRERLTALLDSPSM
jgi:hypothetical protein